MSFTTHPSKRVSIYFEPDSGLTEQSHKDATDIHQIMRRATKTGILEHVNKYAGTYGTMPTGEEFHEHMNIIARAETMFESLPSKIRNEFENSPAKYLDFMQDAENKIKIQEMGLDASHLPDLKPKVENATEEVTSPS